ncbi:MAG TPA: TonB-dependent receptor [Bacteroidales bacterium]|nr:TonB-dependent receptor [Bacteroidales bacterium]
MRKIASYIVLVFMAIAVPAQSVEGYIMDSNHKPIMDVNVILKGTRFGTISNESGYYMINSVKKGSYQMELTHVGYAPVSQNIVLDHDTVLKLDFVLAKAYVTIDGVVIRTESGNNFDQIDIPVRTKLMDEQEIKRIPSISASKLFDAVSGVNVSNEFGIFSSTTVVALRGIGGGSQTGTLIVYDGVPLNKTDGGSVNWNIIDKDNIGKIEIIKGPGSALYGSNAMGGIINMMSKPPDGKLSGKISLSSGTFKTLELKTDLSGSFYKGLFFWKTFFNHHVSDGYINTPDEIIKENDSIVVPVFLKEWFAGGSLGYYINENNTIELSFQYFNDIRGRGVKIYEDVGSNTERDTYRAFIKYKGQVKNWRLYSNVYGLYEKFFRMNEYYSDGAYTLYEVDSRREDYGLRIWAESPVGKKNEITFGGEAKIGKVNGKDIYYTSTDLISNSGTMNTYALFVQDKLTFGKDKWNLLAGLRADGAMFHDATFAIEHPSYSVEYLTGFQFDGIDPRFWISINPKLTLQYSPLPSMKMYISIARGFRAPVLDDLCRSEQSRYGFRVANPAIKPEHLYNIELGADNTFFKILKTEVSVYFSKGLDFMSLLSTADSVNLGYTIAPIYQVSNISSVNIYGLEADVSAPIGKYLRAYINYTFNHSTVSRFVPNTAADRDLTGKFLPDVPMHQFSSGISLRTDYFNLSVSGKYTGTRWIKDDNTVDNIFMMTDRYPARFITDIKVWQNVGPFDFSIDIDNLFNIVYINSKGYKSPGRMVLGKISYTFSANNRETQ